MSTQKEKKEGCKQCSARSKRTGERCKKKAMRGKNVCMFHGGKSISPPKGNKRALKTGEHEKILLDTLDIEEKRYYQTIKPDPIEECEEKIKILKVRELRMMRRIKTLRDKIASENGAGLVVVAGSKTQTVRDDGEKTTTTTAQTKSPEVLLAETEEALTRVQNELGRWVDRLAMYREKYGKGEEDGPLDITLEIVDMRKKAQNEHQAEAEPAVE